MVSTPLKTRTGALKMYMLKDLALLGECRCGVRGRQFESLHLLGIQFSDLWQGSTLKFNSELKIKRWGGLGSDTPY